MAASKVMFIFMGFLVLMAMSPRTDGAFSKQLAKTIHKINKKGPFLGVVVPNTYEMNPLLQSSSFVPDEQYPYLDFSGRRFRVGTLENEKIIMVMTGLGMINAGITTQLLLSLFSVKGVVHYGIAGNANTNLQIGDVTIPQYWAHTGLWNWQRYGDGPDNELALESNGDYTRSIGYLKFSDYNNGTKDAEASDNLLNNVWYQPEEIFPVDGVPEERDHAFWVPVDDHYLSLAAKLELWGKDLRLSSDSTEDDQCEVITATSENIQVQTDYTEQFTTNMVFKCREELIQWARAVGRAVGFVLTIASSNQGEFGQKPYLLMQCERSGHYRSIKISSKKTSTRKCNCPFRLKGIKLEVGNDWVSMVVCGIHNHPAAYFMEGHSYAGRLSEDETGIMIDLSKNLVKPRDILSTLKARDPLNVSTIKTIYNARQKHRVAETTGRSQMQQLMFNLDKHDYISWHRSHGESNELQDLFFAHPCSLDLLRAFPHILLMDTTYKTNRFNMPLFEIVGVTSTELTFSVAFVFIQFEKEDNFAWALSCLRSTLDGCSLPRVVLTDRDLALMNAVDRVFPESTALLCKWHIGRNVLTNCKKLFEEKHVWESFYSKWFYLVDSDTTEEYSKRLLTIEQSFRRYPKAVNYIKTTWLNKYKERFVKAWTKAFM